MDTAASSGRRLTGSRSRNGCSTCRAAKVKCDETQPVCERCKRCGLLCAWRKLPPLRVRRREHASFRSRNGWWQRELLPNVAPFSTHGLSYDNEGFLATASDPPAFGTFQLEVGSNSNSDWLLGMLQDPMLFFDQIPNANDLMAQGDAFPSSDDLSLGIGLSDLAESQAEPQNDYVSMVPSGTSMLDLASTLPPIPGLLAQFSDRPASMDLSPPEQYALYYYQHSLSLSHTTKDPIWSTSMVFLRIGSKRPVVMHLLLAASLKSIVSNHEVSDLSDMLVIAKHNYQMGAKLLIDKLSNEVDPDHVSVMTAFWFLYLYRSRQANLNMGEMTQLSQKVADYVRKHELDRLCADPSTESAPETPIGLKRRKRSLLARLLIWIFYADVSFGFRYRGGSLAKYLSEDIERTGRVYDTSKAILRLHWGTKYPVHQVSDDLENSEVLEMLYKSFMVYHAINELSDSIRADGLADKSIERKLIDIEEKHISIFVLANSAGRERPRLWQNADWVASLFYAIRIYHFRSTVSDAHAQRPTIVEEALSSLIGIAYRTYTSGPSELYRCPQWPLLIAGAETSDPIHRDWILKHMSPDIYKKALEKVIKAQEEIGGRIEMSRLREMCDVGGSDDESDRESVKRIGFGAWC